MKKALLPFALLVTMGLVSCNKNDDDGGGSSSDLLTTEKSVAENFGDNVAFASYTDLKTAGDNLTANVNAFVAAPDAAKLETAKASWRAMRAIWEQSEGFLFGPVDVNEYDPKTDTWPTDYNQMDALLNSSNPLNLSDIQALDYSLRGYHPLEYMLWGENSNKTVAEFTPRQMKYLQNLALDLQSQVTANYNDWTEGGYKTQVTNAGQGSADFIRYYDLFYTMTEGMVGICNEVGKSDEGSGKIWEPFSANNMLGDSSIVESPYSENSMTDFKNNITGAYNVYLGKYKTNGKGLTDIVKLYDKNLDAEIISKFQAAISSFDLVNVSFEKAIYTQRQQLQTIIDAIGEVRDELNEKLHPFLLEHVTN